MKFSRLLSNRRTDAISKTSRVSFSLHRIAMILAIIVAAFPALVFAGAGITTSRLDHLLDRVQAHYRQTNSFEAKFSEELTSPGGIKRKRKGTLYYRKPGRMRWEFAAPDSETIVSDGTIVYSYQPDLNQVIETPVKQLLKSPGAVTFLLGFGDLRRDFKVSSPVTEQPDGLTHLILIPREGGNRTDVGLNKKNLNLISLQVIDAAGDSTFLRFRGWQENPVLADSLFNFTVPSGADIVRTPGAP
ncbi:MAG: outer-membrane lipoprotein carrier protein LolA [Candidatus Binataceae bacterium]|nr:outer-membrane lipoprotein carrier protein LolA [Candidatus Binataceae bacterium]